MDEDKKTSFEEGLKRLNEIADKMNDNILPLADAMSLYKEAKQLINSLNAQIDEAEKLLDDKVKD